MHAGAPTLGGYAVPGDVGSLRSAAVRFDAAGSDVQALAGQIAAIKIQGWTGTAATAFSGSLAEFPPPLHQAAQAFAQVGDAIRVFSGELHKFQDEAQRIATTLAHERADLAELQHHEATLKQRAGELEKNLETLTLNPIKMAENVYHGEVNAARTGLTAAGVVMDDVHNKLAGTSGNIQRLEREAEENYSSYQHAAGSCAHTIEAHTHALTVPAAHKASSAPADYSTLFAAATAFAGAVVAAGPAGAAIAWAEPYVGKNAYPGECLLFVWDAYRVGAGVSLWNQVKGGRGAYPSDGPYPQDLWGKTFGENFACPPGTIGHGTPPAGALIFFESSTHNRQLSHVTLSLGGGKMISTEDGNKVGAKGLVHEETMAERAADRAIYKGWWLPGS